MSVKNIVDAISDQDLRLAKKLFGEEMKARAVARIMERKAAIARSVMGEGEFVVSDLDDDEFDDEFDDDEFSDFDDDEFDDFDEL